MSGGEVTIPLDTYTLLRRLYSQHRRREHLIKSLGYCICGPFVLLPLYLLYLRKATSAYQQREQAALWWRRIVGVKEFIAGIVSHRLDRALAPLKTGETVMGTVPLLDKETVVLMKRDVKCWTSPRDLSEEREVGPPGDLVLTNLRLIFKNASSALHSSSLLAEINDLSVAAGPVLAVRLRSPGWHSQARTFDVGQDAGEWTQAATKLMEHFPQ